MKQEELILKTLFEIKEDLGGLRSDVVAGMKANDAQDMRLNTHARAIGSLETSRTASKARLGLIGSLSGVAGGFLGWIGTFIFEAHKLK